MQNFNDRRSDQRKEVHWPVMVTAGGKQFSGETVNVSAGGVALCFEEPLPLEEVLKISIMAPDHNIIELRGEVAWSDLGGIDDQNRTVGIGVCFVEAGDKERRRLVEALRKNPK